MRDLWWTKCNWGKFPLSTSVTLANSNSTKCSILTWYPRLLQKLVNGRRTKWTQSHPNPRN
jgi:hypothetical protein